MKQEDMGASAEPTRLSSDDGAAARLHPPGFDPSRSISVVLPRGLLDQLAVAERLAEISFGYGHGPGAHCEKGERIAGYYYRNADAKAANVMPAHSMGATRYVIRALAELVRDSDGSRNGRDAQRLDGEAATARAEGIAPEQSDA